MFELLGLVFGGVSRLAQHWLDLKDKQAERMHEGDMFDKQVELASRRMEQDMALRHVDAEAASESAEWNAIAAGAQSQAAEAQAAGGWVAKLSASVRPILSYWFTAIYTIAKFSTFYMSLKAGVPFPDAVRAMYTEFDGVIMASILSFYFADRSLRKK